VPWYNTHRINDSRIMQTHSQQLVVDHIFSGGLVVIHNKINFIFFLG
jgi:hypothetical protein